MLIIADNQPLTRDALASYFGNQSVHFAMSKDEVSHLLQQTPTGSVILDFSGSSDISSDTTVMQCV